jgi:hypothetical protein
MGWMEAAASQAMDAAKLYVPLRMLTPTCALHLDLPHLDLPDAAAGGGCGGGARSVLSNQGFWSVPRFASNPHVLTMHCLRGVLSIHVYMYMHMHTSFLV